MPQGKPAGVRCVQLGADNRCRIFGHRDRPAVCTQLRPAPDMCGGDADHAHAYLEHLEQMTRPLAAAPAPQPSERSGHGPPKPRAKIPLGHSTRGVMP